LQERSGQGSWKGRFRVQSLDQRTFGPIYGANVKNPKRIQSLLNPDTTASAHLDEMRLITKGLQTSDFLGTRAYSNTSLIRKDARVQLYMGCGIESPAMLNPASGRNSTSLENAVYFTGCSRVADDTGGNGGKCLGGERRSK